MLLQKNQQYEIHHGDCVERMACMDEESVDFSVFSPPFPQMFAYQSSLADIGNSEDVSGAGDMKLHLSFFYRQLARIVKPGRVVMVHVAQIPRMKRVDALGGLHDFRGTNIRLGCRAGLVYEYDWMIRKNPQAQALRTRSRELQFSGLESDRARSRGALPDYLIKFRVKGDNKIPIDSDGQVSRNNWIEWAEGCWSNIRETDTLNTLAAKSESDVRHICALQLSVIERLIRLYSNPGEIVFSPFAGIGSELYMALKLGRRAYGCELKREYYDAAILNCNRAITSRKEEIASLFDMAEST